MALNIWTFKWSFFLKKTGQTDDTDDDIVSNGNGNGAF